MSSKDKDETRLDIIIGTNMSFISVIIHHLANVPEQDIRLMYSCYCHIFCSKSFNNDMDRYNIIYMFFVVDMSNTKF